MKKKIFTSVIALFAIASAMQAQTYSEQVVAALISGQDVTLTDNVDLSLCTGNFDANGWIPLPAYAGTLDGAGFTISGLWSNRSNENSVGLFSQLNSGATVENLNIEMDDNEGGIVGSNEVGGLAGQIAQGGGSGAVTISAVHVTSANLSGAGAVGGIVGYVNVNCTIDNCTVEGVIGATGSWSNYFGGIVGYKDGDATFALTNCQFTGTVNTQGSCCGNYYVGALAGGIEFNSLVENCSAVLSESNMRGDHPNSGGLIGVFGGGEGDMSSITNCHVSGMVSANGGLVGIYSSGGAMTNCSFESQSAETDVDGGMIGAIQDTGSDATVIDNCYQTGTELNDFGGYNMGGLVGTILSGNVTIKNSYVTCDLPKAYYFQGGLVGIVDAGCTSLTIDNCYYSGSLNVVMGAGGLVGGAAQVADDQTVTVNTTTVINITNSHAEGTFSGNPAGGIIGLFGSGNIQKCFSGCVLNRGGWPDGFSSGGIAGEIAGSAVIDQCYTTDGSSIEGYITGGIVGSIQAGADATIRECYAAGNSFSTFAVNYGYSDVPAGGLVGQVTDGGSLTLNKSFALNSDIEGSPAGVLVGAGSIAASTNNFALEALNAITQQDGAPAFISQTDAQTQTTYTNVSWDFASVWTMGTVAPFYPVFGQSSPSALIIGPTDTKTASDYTSGGYTDIIIQSSEDANSGVISTGQLILDNGDLTVAGVVKFEQSFTSGKWYAVGFPFDVASMSCDGVDHNLKTYDSTGANDSYGDFWLKNDYDYTDNTFAYTTPETSIPAGGYILQVPSDISGKTIAFTSAPGLVLSSSSVFDIQAGNYKITNNPSFANTVVTNNGTTNVDANGNSYYTYESKKPNNFDLATTWTLRPFESLVIANNPPYLRSDLGVDGVTSLPAVNLQGDKVVATEYYNLMGVKVAQPERGNIYVVKTIFESGKTSVVKQVIEK